MTCAKTRVRVTLTQPDGRSWTGENRCRNPQAVCPRALGEDYTKCRTICDQVGHAELDALALAGDGARGSTASIEGHTYYCMECQHALFAAGVVALRAPGTLGVAPCAGPCCDCGKGCTTDGVGVGCHQTFCDQTPTKKDTP